MLNETELNQLMDSRGLPPDGRAMVRHIRNSDPSRRVVAGRGNVSCRYPSRKMRRTIQGESHTNELAALYEWDHDTITHEFYDQPPRIKLNYVDKAGRKRGHNATPDIFLIQKNFIGWVECKPEDWLQKHAAESSQYVLAHDGTWTCPAGSAFAAQYGLEFIVRSSRSNSEILTRNLVFLSDYWDTVQPPPQYESTLTKLESLFSQQGWYRLADMLGGGHQFDPDAVYWAIAHEKIFVNLYETALADLHDVVVFQSELHSKALSLQAKSELALPEIVQPAIYPVVVEVGAKITWDGALYAIKTVTPTTAYLEDGNRQLVSLQNEHFLALTKQGAIRGVQRAEADLQQKAQEIIISAPQEDLQAGVVRHDLLHRMLADPNAAKGVVSDRTVRAWKKLHREGLEVYGNAFVGLISRGWKRGNRCRKMDSEVIAIMTSVIKEEYASNGSTLSKTICYGKVVNECAARNCLPRAKRHSAEH